MWAKNFQMYNLDLEKAKDQKSNCQHRWITDKAREFKKKKKIDFCLIDYAKAFDCVDHNKL